MYNPLAITGYTPALAAAFCEQISQGLSPLSVSRLPGFPSITTVYKWRREYSEFNEAVEIALAIAGDVLAFESLEIADHISDDYKLVVRRDGSTEMVPDQDTIGRAKIRVDTRLKMAGKLNRKQWGDSKQIDIDATLAVTMLSDEEIDRRIAAANSIIIEHEGTGNEDET